MNKVRAHKVSKGKAHKGFAVVLGDGAKRAIGARPVGRRRKRAGSSCAQLVVCASSAIGRRLERAVERRGRLDARRRLDVEEALERVWVEHGERVLARLGERRHDGRDAHRVDDRVVEVFLWTAISASARRDRAGALGLLSVKRMRAQRARVYVEVLIYLDLKWPPKR